MSKGMSNSHSPNVYSYT